MNIYEWITIFSICLIGAVTPGPSLIIILYITNTKSLLSGVLASIGHGCGIFLYATISIFGINLLLQTVPFAIHTLQILGAFFLMFIGWKVLSFKSTENRKTDQYKLPNSLLESYIIGFTSSLINPKVIIFFTAVFSQFINQNYSLQTKFSMSLLAGTIDAFWYILASFSITLLTVQTYIKEKEKNIFMICGFTLILLSLYLMCNLLITLL